MLLNFSTLPSNKFKYINLLIICNDKAIAHIESLMRGVIEKIISWFEVLVNNMQQQKVIKCYFLDFVVCFM